MTPRKPANAKTILAFLAALAGAPAVAETFPAEPAHPAFARLAQLSAEERQAMRERWEQASPEERLRLRREFQERSERLRPLGPPEREARGRRDPADEAGRFGMGFERRRGERLERPDPSADEFFERRRMRDGGRP